jgi:hypothetical protein
MQLRSADEGSTIFYKVSERRLLSPPSSLPWDLLVPSAGITSRLRTTYPSESASIPRCQVQRGVAVAESGVRTI